MPITVERHCFAGMDGLYDVLKARSLWPVMAVHKTLAREQPHWHTQNNQVFVVEGEATFFDGDTGAEYRLSRGDVAIIPRETLHAIEAGGRVVFIAAFDAPMSMTEFVPHPPEALPRRPAAGAR